MPETGGNVTYTYTVTNTGTILVEITSLDDDKFGPLVGDPATCYTISDSSPGTFLAPGASCSFTLTKTISGDAPDEHTNKFTAEAKYDTGKYLSASAIATVSFTDVIPSITLTKTASPTSVLLTGGSVTYTITVKNITAEPVTLNTLSDDKFGNLNGVGTCAVSQTLAGNGSYTCTFTRNVIGTPSNSSLGIPPHINTATATVSDDEGNGISGSGRATVSFFWRGRSPGYWKNNTGTWPSCTVTVDGASVPVTPATLVTKVFPAATPYVKSNLTTL